MMYFAIPLRSKHSSKNWKRVERLFNETIESIYNQTNPNFKIVVACHDTPRLTYKADERLEIINVSFPTPNTSIEQIRDKFYKKYHIMTRIKELGGGFVMFVDADDLISNKIAEFVESDSGDSLGWYLDNGYVYDKSLNKIKTVSEFHKLCGTSAILKYKSSDLPDNVVFLGLDKTTARDYSFQYPHGELIDAYEREKKCKITPLPFEGAIYVTNNGENHSVTRRTFKSNVKIAIKRLLNRNEFKRVTKQISNEFNLNRT